MVEEMKFKLKRPLIIKVSCDGEIWCFENDELEIYGCGKSFEDASKDFKIVFDALVESYIFEADEKLSESALELKKKLSQFVGDNFK
ncbi:MAG: hypothetical protein QW540_10405 [Archaeoglobaceae archaeon]